ncbi:MAG: TetR/AcrR family transcriptional regulator [Planctomycetia bacterium]|nr:TetR/AcrR family transcriptional regulator [Planctomycetia bacterium]
MSSESAGRRNPEREQVRGKILAAARELIVKEGYEAVSMRKIATRVNYTAMALYRHFADKETLLRELCLEDFLTLRHAMDRIAGDPDPIARLRRMGLAYVDFALEFPNQYRLLFMTPLPREAHVEAVVAEHPEVDCYAWLRDTVAEAVSARRFRPGLDDADLISQVFWAGLHGIVSFHIVMKRSPLIAWRPVRASAEVVIAALFDGLVEPA